MGVTVCWYVGKPVTATEDFLHYHQYNISRCMSVSRNCFQAVDLTVQLMEMGEKAIIQTDAKYAYGTLGR